MDILQRMMQDVLEANILPVCCVFKRAGYHQIKVLLAFTAMVV